jgi:hypothetical protein
MLGSLLLLLLSEKGICQIHESKPSPVQKVMEKVDVCFRCAGWYDLHGIRWISLTLLYAHSFPQFPKSWPEQLWSSPLCLFSNIKHISGNNIFWAFLRICNQAFVSPKAHSAVAYVCRTQWRVYIVCRTLDTVTLIHSHNLFRKPKKKSPAMIMSASALALLKIQNCQTCSEWYMPRSYAFSRGSKTSAASLDVLGPLLSRSKS